MNDTVVAFENVVKKFGDQRAVDDVSFTVNEGRIFGLLGPNGAGKTTSIRMLTHILVPDSGVIRVYGEQAGPGTQHKLGYLPEERGLYKKMKVGEQLVYLCRLRGLSRHDAREKIRFWLDRFGASDWTGKEIGELSKGMQQKIQFVATIAHDPQCLIFDEPFSGLDPINSEMLKEVILELRAAGKTIFFATHRMEQVEQLCDDIALFNNGKLVLNGELSQIKASYGKNSIRLKFHGDHTFLDRLENVRINNRSVHYAEIRLLDGADDQAILREAQKHARVEGFELIEPGLQEIFIDTVTG
ncbi:ATP-binding cassette domain-containing protein [Balneolales bacterium ANBcel1]|nr:ATP-binding cassette domain-containing protein [Balneolales bacterium ANBcel1]